MDTSVSRVRSERKPRHFWADNELYDDYAPIIGVFAFAVYMALCRYADANTAKSYPSQTTIAKQLKVSETTVKKAIKVLEREGLISVKRNRRTKSGDPDTNQYKLLPLKEVEGVGHQTTHSGASDDPQVGHQTPTNNTNYEQNSINNQRQSAANAAPEAPKPSKARRDEIFEAIMIDLFGKPKDDPSRKGFNSLVGGLSAAVLNVYPDITREDLSIALKRYRANNGEYALKVRKSSTLLAAIADNLPGATKAQDSAARLQKIADKAAQDRKDWKF